MVSFRRQFLAFLSPNLASKILERTDFYSSSAFNPYFRLFNPAGGGAIPISNNNPYINNPAIPPGLIPPHPNPGGNPIPPHILMAAMQQQDRPLPPSFGPSAQPEPPNPLFRKESENSPKSPSVSPVTCSISPNTSKVTDESP